MQLRLSPGLEKHRSSRTRFTSKTHPRPRRTFRELSSLLAHPDHTTLSSRPEDVQGARRGDVCSPHSSVFNDAHPRLVQLPFRSGTEIPLLSGRAYRSRRNARLRRTGRSGEAFSTPFSRPFPAEPLTPRRLRLGSGALSGPSPSLRPSPLLPPPREGDGLFPDRDASTDKTSEEVLSKRRLSTPLDDPMLFTLDPSDPPLDGFTFATLAALAPPPGIACRLVQLFKDTTRGQIRDSDPRVRCFGRWVTCSGTSPKPPAECRLARSASLRQHLAPLADFPEHPCRLPESRGPRRSLVPSKRPRPRFATRPAKGASRLRTGCLPPSTLGCVRAPFQSPPASLPNRPSRDCCHPRDGDASCASQSRPPSTGITTSEDSTDPSERESLATPLNRPQHLDSFCDRGISRTHVPRPSESLYAGTANSLQQENAPQCSFFIHSGTPELSTAIHSHSTKGLSLGVFERNTNADRCADLGHWRA